ncbi:hypothetical protein ABK040_007103 [Willaertia magna]
MKRLTLILFIVFYVVLVHYCKLADQTQLGVIKTSVQFPVKRAVTQGTFIGLPAKRFFNFEFGYGYWRFGFQTNQSDYLIGYIPLSNINDLNQTTLPSTFSTIATVGSKIYDVDEYRFAKYDQKYQFVIYNPSASNIEFYKISVSQLYKNLTFDGQLSFETPAFQSDYYFCANCFDRIKGVDLSTDRFGIEITTDSNSLEYLDLFVGVNRKATPTENYDIQQRTVFQNPSDPTKSVSKAVVPLQAMLFPATSIYIVVQMSGCKDSCGYKIRVIKTNASTSKVEGTYGVGSAIALGVVGGIVCLGMMCIGSLTVLTMYVCFLKKHKTLESELDKYLYLSLKNYSDAASSNADNDIQIEENPQIQRIKNEVQRGFNSNVQIIVTPEQNELNKNSSLTNTPVLSTPVMKSPKLEDKISSLKTSFLAKYLNSKSGACELNVDKQSSFCLDVNTASQTEKEIVVDNGGVLYKQDSGLEYNVASAIESYHTEMRRGSSEEDASYIQSMIDDISDKLKERYKVVSFIGRGSFASVFLAIDERTKEQVAIKSISLLADDEESIRKVREEGLRMLECKHSNIISIFDVFPCPSLHSVCFTMHYYQYGDLKSVMEKRTDLLFSKKLIVTMIRQLGSALDYLHNTKSIIHNDLKPGNIFVDDLDIENEWIEVAIGDFGESVKKNGKEEKTGVVGTELYIAPEILFGTGKLSFASDIWSLGCTLYQILSCDFTTKITEKFKGMDGLPDFTKEKQVHEELKANMKKVYDFDDYLTDSILLMLKCLPEERWDACAIKHMCI